MFLSLLFVWSFMSMPCFLVGVINDENIVPHSTID